MTETPYDHELEQMVIGNAFVSKRLTGPEKAISTLDFFSIQNQQIWSAIMELDESNQPIEIFDVVAALNKTTITGSFLSQMTVGLPSHCVRPDDIKRLKDLATLRRMILSFNELTKKAINKEPVIDIIEDAQSLIDSVKDEQDARQGTSQSLIEVMEWEVFPRLDKFVSGEMVKVPFGFPRLDESTNGGSSPGELVVFGAHPKSGKSCMMLQVARNVAAQNLPTLLMSMEMLNYENGFRFLSQSSQFSVNIFRPNMQGFVADRLKDHAKTHYALPFRFDQKSRTTKALGLEIQRLKDDTSLACAFVDYVQLIRTDRRGQSRTEKIEEAIYDLKELAMKHEIVIYTAAQFNREGIKADKPTLAHFDGSSAIEKAANLALFWQLDKEFDEAIEGRKGKLWIEVGRSVATDEFDIVFHGKKSFFTVT